MAHKGCSDTDKGLAKIFEEMGKLKSMCVKVGVTEDTGSQVGEDGATVAQYASWNELGTDDGRIPPRPFIRGFADGKRELIALTMEKLGNLVTGGKLDAGTAIRLLGEFGMNGIKSYIKHGDFAPNADSTIAKKGSSKPLIDTKTLVNNGIRFQVIEKPMDMVSES